jgi:hypothetical protein
MTNLPRFIASMCHYAQEHINDREAWPATKQTRMSYFECTSYAVACFIAQNTLYGYEGVESSIVLESLAEYPIKTKKEWEKIINDIAKEYHGWK